VRLDGRKPTYSRVSVALTFIFQAIRLGENVLGSSRLSLRLGLLDHIACGASLDSYGLLSQHTKELLEQQPEIKLLAPILRLDLQKNGMQLKDSKVSKESSRVRLAAGTKTVTR
jgi:hypothetical protein